MRAALSVTVWTLAVGLRPLSCSEAETYLTAKLAAAGCREAIFSQRAVTRLHVHSRGSPRGLDRLASLCLMAGAYRGLEAISSDVVEACARRVPSTGGTCFAGMSLRLNFRCERPHLQSLGCTRLGVDSRSRVRASITRDGSCVHPVLFEPKSPLMSQPTVPLRHPYRAAFLAWLVPGLGPLLPGSDRQGLAVRDLHPGPVSRRLRARRREDRLLAVGQPAEQSREVLPLLPRPVLRGPACAARLDPGNPSLPRARS